MSKCKVWDCDGKVVGWGWCDAHYRRFRKHKDTGWGPLKRELSLHDRFHDRYMPVTESGCWIWTRALSGPAQYGIIAFNGKNLFAHRASWILHNGPIPEGMYVLHKCDTPSCVNPDHLFLGTPKDNMQDALSKGRLNYMPGVLAGAKARRSTEAQKSEAIVRALEERDKCQQ